MPDHELRDLRRELAAIERGPGKPYPLELRRRKAELPIIYITAQTDETIRPRVLASGAVECLFKPFSDTALLEAINAARRPN